MVSARSVWIRSFSIGLIGLWMVACSDPKVTILPGDIPKTVPAGDQFRHQFEAEPTLEGGAFLRCGRPQEGVKVEGDGVVTFLSQSPGEVKELCIAYRNRDGATRAKHKFEVTVAPRAKTTDEDYSPVVATHRKRLRALAAAAAKAPLGKRCSKGLAKGEAVPYTVYDTRWITKALDQADPDPNAPRFLGPPGKLARHLTWKESRLDLVTKGTVAEEYAVVLTSKALVLPEISKGRTFRSGVFVGAAHVGKVATGQVVCSAPLAFGSSQKIDWVEFREKGDVQESSRAKIELEMDRDFAANGRKALAAALKKIAPRLKKDR